MRVLMSADPIGGVWTYALDLSRALAQFDVHVVLATLGAPLTGAQRREVSALRNVTHEASRYKLEWMPDPWKELEAAGEWLLALAERHRVDLVHLNHLSHGQLPFTVPVLTVVHSCVLSWWDHVRGDELPAHYARYRARVQTSLAGSHAVVTVTHAMARAVERHYGPLPDVSVIHNARPPVPIGADDKEPLVFTAGRVWDAAKNVAAVVKAAPRIAWPVVVAGSEQAPNPATDADDVVAATMRAGVRFTGRLSSQEMAEYFRRSSVYALPARYEPFGLTILEAAQAGCALVLGDIPTLRELWDDAACFVAPDDEAALVRTLRGIIADDTSRRAMARVARRRAASFSFARFVEAYRKAYATMISPGRVRDGRPIAAYP